MIDLFNDADDLEVGTDAILRFYNEDDAKRFIMASCHKMNLTITRVMSSSREENDITPRHLFTYIVKKHSMLNWDGVGKIFKRNRVTIMHSYNIVENVFEYHRKYPATTTKEYEYYHFWYECLLNN